MQTDFHMHSTHSVDGNNSPFEMCEQALALGLDAIAITDHYEWLPDGRVLRPDFSHYFADIAACRDQFAPRGLQVLSGIEFGNPHEHEDEVDGLLSAYDFDVVIASVHWLGDQNIHFAACFDGADPYDVYAAYFRTMAEMAMRAEYDIVAHFDRFFAPGTSRFGPPLIERLEDEIRPVLEAIVARDRILELNTRFLLDEPGWNDSLVTVLRWYRQAGGAKIEVNSDAHRTADIGRSLAEGEALLAEAGYDPAVTTGIEIGMLQAD